MIIKGFVNMRFNPVKTVVEDAGILKSEFSSSRQIGSVRLGDTCLFFKSGFKQYYIPYTDIKSCFRRVMGVPMKVCCGKGELQIENLVIGDDEKELAVVQLPGTIAARELIAELKERIPDADFSARKAPVPADPAAADAQAAQETAAEASDE